jgi:hypothetical protein
MSKKEFVIRGQTASGGTETLNFGIKDGYAYRLVEFSLYPSTNIAGVAAEMVGSVTAGKTAVAPTDPNYNNEGLIATTSFFSGVNNDLINNTNSVINDTFLITQDLILMVQDQASGGNPINWQCRFIPVKMSESDIANQNYRQFMIFDE